MKEKEYSVNGGLRILSYAVVLIVPLFRMLSGNLSLFDLFVDLSVSASIVIMTIRNTADKAKTIKVSIIFIFCMTLLYVSEAVMPHDNIIHKIELMYLVVFQGVFVSIGYYRISNKKSGTGLKEKINVSDEISGFVMSLYFVIVISLAAIVYNGEQKIYEVIFSLLLISSFFVAALIKSYRLQYCCKTGIYERNCENSNFLEEARAPYASAISQETALPYDKSLISFKSLNPDKKRVEYLSEVRQSDLYSRFISYVEEYKPFLNDDCSIDTMAKELYTNKSYLSAMVNKYTGLSFPKLMNRYRINYSVELFKENPKMKISELYLLAGFRNPVSYNLAFKFFMNSCPNEWFREWRDRQIIDKFPSNRQVREPQ